jgi:hypothetical protein
MSIRDFVVELMWSRSCRAGSRLVLAPLTVALLAVGVAGCAATLALDRAVVAYDMTTTDSVAKQLLLNIARARHNQPMHFTGISSVAATYKVSVNAGFGGALTGNSGGLIVPVFGTSAEENPTISIAPIQGEEFTQRLLTPFQEQKLTLLLRQGYDVDSLLRLMGAEIRLENNEHSLGTGDRTVYYNRPSDREGYPVFRRVMAHLSSIQDRHALYVEPLHFQYSWTIPANSVTPEAFQSVYKDFSLTYDAEKHVYRVSRRINGRVIVTNYDPAVLSNEERFLLHEQAEEAPFNDILVDIRPGYPGGELPLHGRIRLRSFHEILTFIGRGIEEEPEYDVPPDPRTPSISENPPHTLEILEARSLPPGVDLSASLKGYQYAVQPQSGYQWNRKAFSLLYQLFQMTVATVPPSGPAITISK